jgi:hypothetical protein
MATLSVQFDPKFLNVCESIVLMSRMEPAWAANYLNKHRVELPDYFFNQEFPTPSLPIQLAQQFQKQNLDLNAVRDLKRAMGVAFRVGKHRKDKGLVNFSVSLEKTVYKQLSEMSGKNKRNKVITALIQQNFQSLLIQEQHTKIRVEEEKNKKALATLQNQLKQLNLASAFKALQSASQTVPTDSLINGITQLYEIIQSSHKTGAAIDALAFLKATEIYTAGLRNASEEASKKKLPSSE